MKKTLLAFFLLISIYSFSQDVIMQNGSINVCSGTFYDSGGASYNYSNNESLVFTICPENAGQRTKVEFTEFLTQLNIDTLKVYDGDSTNDVMFGTFSGTNDTFSIFVATVNNATGCLTFEFTSNGSANTTGWAANISCLEACQDITAQLDSTNPAPNTDGFIDVCIGDPITFNGSGTFSVDGTGATYNWDLGDGTTVEGESVTVSYAISGVFLVSLEIRDTNTSQNPLGCHNINAVHQIVRVSNTPDFAGTQADNDVLCFGESTNIEGMATPQTLIYDCPPPESVETFLPDGSGAVYNTCISVTCFDPSATLTDISQIADICMNIEHSYSGDLFMKIISPNGQEAILKDYPGGGGTFLGDANDDGTTNPGIGLDYCFAMDGTVTLLNAPTITAPSSPAYITFAPGTYLPEESFAQLIGSPLNGQWCIEIVDNLAVDNGYIFSWELNFNDNLPQEGFDYIPAIVTESWDADPSITAFNGNTITVAPTTSGEHCYTYRTTDEFGCEYTEQVCVTVAEAGVPPQTFYLDNDNDGYGDANSYIVECSPAPPNGYVLNDLDCDDINNLINPDAEDSEGNGIDENCDGVDGDALSLNEFNINTVNISPNPFDNVFNINLPTATQSHTIDVIIYDLSGRKVYTQQYANINNSITVSNLDALNESIYFVTISNQTLGIDITKKILKR